MDPQQAKFLTDQMTGLWEGEFKATCAVLSSVPDHKRDYMGCEGPLSLAARGAHRDGLTSGSSTAF